MKLLHTYTGYSLNLNLNINSNESFGNVNSHNSNNLYGIYSYPISKTILPNYNLTSSSNLIQSVLLFNKLNFIYILVFLSLIFVGIVVNLIVITTYKYGDKSKMLINSTSTNINLTNKIFTFKSMDPIDKLNLNANISSTKSKQINNPSDDVFISSRQRRYTETLYNRMIENMYNQQKHRRTSISNQYSQRASPCKDLLKDAAQTPFYLTLPILTPTVVGNSHLSIRRTLCSYFILSLGFCDLIICLLNMPFNLFIESGFFQVDLMNFLQNQSIRPDLYCKTAYFLLQIPITLEIEILLMIAIDRYSSVFRSIESYFFDKSKFKQTLLLLIAFGAFLSFPNIFFYTSNTNQDNILQYENAKIGHFIYIGGIFVKYKRN